MAARDEWALDADAVWLGMRSATLPGRFERRVIAGRTVVLDGAHNPMKLAALVATLREVYPGARFPWVLAFKQDKDLDGAMQVIGPAATHVVATEFRTDGGDHPACSSVPAERIAAAAGKHGIPAAVDSDAAFAVSRAMDEADEALPVVVSGSFHLLATVHAASVPQ
jgi:dihydrofolate synthase/folylpolyglutamate synthase